MMNQNTKPPSGSSQSSEHTYPYYQSHVSQYADIDEYFLQEIKFGNVSKEPVNAIDFARLLHHRIRLSPGDRNIYALEYYIGGYRCYNSSFISRGQQIVRGMFTLNILCFSHSILSNKPVFDKTLALVGIMENKVSNSTILVLQECPTIN